MDDVKLPALPTPKSILSHEECVYSESQIRSYARAAVLADREARQTEALHRFLDAAGGEGLVLDGVDAGDLYAAVFPERYHGQRAKEDV